MRHFPTPSPSSWAAWCSSSLACEQLTSAAEALRHRWLASSMAPYWASSPQLTVTLTAESSVR